jgi:hypothetical protein
MPLQATSGAASYDAFGGGVPVAVNYIEDVFNTYFYTGNGSTQTITNGIDLSTKGGMVWIKGTGGTAHRLTDTVRGATKSISSNSTAAEITESTGLTAFGTTGFDIGADTDYNTSSSTYASWSFRKQPKFFDIVTYTGNGFGSEAIAHNLGSVPGFVLIKRTDSTSNWGVWHRKDGVSAVTYFSLNSTSSGSTDTSYTDFTTATTFVVDGIGPTSGPLNVDGASYVAYLFAHNAGGFGLTGTDNVISCGSYTGTGSAGNAQTLGYEPQWMLVKNASTSATNWFILDVSRGFSLSTDSPLYANLSAAQDFLDVISPTATGFQFTTGSTLNTSSATFIYIAIRRPMKVPTSGTSVYAGQLTTAAPVTLTGLEAPDTIISRIRGTTNANFNHAFADRLRGNDLRVVSTNTDAEASFADTFVFNAGQYATSAITAGAMVYWTFKRAPSFYDVVCYTGTGSNTTVTHNLKAVPELIICKRRDTTGDWDTYCSALANTEYLVVNTTAAKATGATRWNSTTPTSSVFSVGTSTNVNASAGTYVARLFATCAGVSKVGSYTGTATTLQVDCGFTGGARFVLIKRTDSTGAWYLWDSARGIIAGDDPYILLNSTAVEVTNTDYIDTYSAGFELSSTAPAAINASGGTYIFLAIA